MSQAILVSPNFPENGRLVREWCEKNNSTYIDGGNAQTEQEFIDLAQKNNATIVVTTGLAPYLVKWSDNLVNGLPDSVNAICNYSAGYDALGDLERFKKRGIIISNTPNGVAQATADTGLYLILGTLRNFGRLAHSLKEGHFKDDIPLAQEYDGKTLGILGFGGIGSLIRDKVEACFDFKKIQYHNRRRAPAEREKNAVYVPSFDELLATSDVILGILPLSAGTHHIFNKEAFAKMKKGAVFINIGRGPTHDEEALVEALESGHLSSVGLDVFENEPKVHPKLLASKNTLLLPHAGTYTVESRQKMALEIVENIESFHKTGTLLSLLPEFR